MEYICKTCGAVFEEPESNKLISSLLARFLITKCPYCFSPEVYLSEKTLLRLGRKHKIEKIENNTERLN